MIIKGHDKDVSLPYSSDRTAINRCTKQRKKRLVDKN